MLVFRPEDGRAMYAGEGSLPNIPGFDFFQLMRERMSDPYRSTGLVTNKPEWAQVYDSHFRQLKTICYVAVFLYSMT